MGEFGIIKIFCSNYLKYIKTRKKITVVFYNNGY